MLFLILIVYRNYFLCAVACEMLYEYLLENLTYPNVKNHFIIFLIINFDEGGGGGCSFIESTWGILCIVLWVLLGGGTPLFFGIKNKLCEQLDYICNHVVMHCFMSLYKKCNALILHWFLIISYYINGIWICVIFVQIQNPITVEVHVLWVHVKALPKQVF